MKKELIALSDSDGEFGFEYELYEQISTLLKPYCTEVSQDKMGNVLGIRPCGKKDAKTLLLEAHIDGRGLMVKDIDEKGFVTFVCLGTVDERSLLATEVIIKGREPVFGVIGAKPMHLFKSGEGSKTLKTECMAIDTGYPVSRVRELVKPGDRISFVGKAKELSDDIMSGRVFDNRAGLVSVLMCLEQLKDKELDFDIAVLASVQKDIGLRGAAMGANSIRPAAAFVVDACHGITPDSGTNGIFPLGKGCVLNFGPNIHPYLSSLAKKCAKDLEIPVHYDAYASFTGTSAWPLQVACGGIPVLLLSIPVRYRKTITETLSFRDVAATANLLAGTIEKLDMEEMLCYYGI